MLRSKYIRLFVSSTFEDMVVERNILQEKVFPRISKLCQSRGWLFEDIDLRWGISLEASQQQKTMQICIDELKRCQQFSPKPNFLILQGDRNGWIPLPESIPFADGEKILTIARNQEISLFNKWYRLDENSIEKEYILQPKDGIHSAQYAEEVEIPLRGLFDRFANTLDNNEKKLLYNGSATMQEIYHGALSVADANKHVILYSRTLTNVPKADLPKFGDPNKSLFSFLSPKSSHEKFKELLGTTLSNVIEKKLSYQDMYSDKYAHDFEESIYAYLERVVLDEIEQNTIVDQIEFDREVSNNFIAERNSFFVAREHDTHSLINMISNSNGRPIVLTGPSGVGKSSLIANVVTTCASRMTVLSRFIGHAFSRASGMELLRSIWLEMDKYGKYDKNFSIFNFSERLQKTSYDTPMLIVIDGIDQLSPDDEFLSMNWLPDRLEGNVQLLYSVLDRTEYTSLYQNREVQQYQLLPFDHTNAMEYIDQKLKWAGRQLTKEQHSQIELAINSSVKLPIYLNLLTYFAARLHSYEKIKDIPTEVNKLLFLFFDELAQPENHGELLVKKVFSYLVSTKYGISHSEIREILAKDKEYWSAFIQASKHHIEVPKVPSVVVIRLLNDLSSFTNQQSVFDGVHAYFNHRIVLEAACEWLKKENCYVHEELFNYYDAKWRENNLHAIYEVSYQALQYNDQVAFDLYTNLDYCIAKIIHSASDILRPDLLKLQANMANLAPIPTEAIDNLRIFSNFDTEAKAYAMSLDSTQPTSVVENKIVGLAANWAKGSIVRRAFEKSIHTYPSLVNTMSPRDYNKRLYTPLPFTVNDSAMISDDGNFIIWNQEGKLYIYDTQKATSTLLPIDVIIDNFWVSNDFSTLIALQSNTFIIYDIANKTSIHRYTISNTEIQEFGIKEPHVHFKADHNFVIVFRTPKFLYKCYSSNNSLHCTTYPINPKFDYQIAGLLKDGQWVIILTDTTQQENNVEQLYKCLVFYELSDTLTYKYQCSSKWKKNHMFPYVVSSSGYNLVLYSKHDTTDDVCICDFTNDEPKKKDINLSASYGRGNTYAAHISKDEKTFWSINGGMRLILFDIEQNCNLHVINTSREYQMFKASANNQQLLLTINQKGYFDGRANNYDTILTTNNITAAIDYFPSQLSTISVDAKAEHIFTSHGWDIQVNMEGATMFDISPDTSGFSRTEYNNPEERNTIFSTSTAISLDGERRIYSRTKLTEYIGKHKKKYYRVPCEDTKITWPFYMSRLEYTPDGSAFLALSGDTLVTTSKNGYLFLTDDAQKNALRYIIDLPKKYSFTRSAISNNGKYAMVWASDHTNNSFVGLWIDLTTGEIISQLFNAIDMKFFPDSRASMQTIITQLIKSPKPFSPPALVQGTTLIDNIYIKDLKIQKHTNPTIALGDIAPSGRFHVLMDYSLAHGTRLFSTLNTATISFYEYVNACRIAYDDIHMFVICDTIIYLVSIPEMRIIQKIQMNYLHDGGNRRSSFHFMRHLVVDERMVNNKEEKVHNGRHFQLYDKGLVISDWDHIFRIEPDNYKINEISFATISRVWDHGRNAYDEPKALCPMCGKRFTPSKSVLDTIASICKDLEPCVSPCLHLAKNAWEVQELKGHTCPHCGNKLRFNPFIS